MWLIDADNIKMPNDAIKKGEMKRILLQRPGIKETKKYNKMIYSFQCDFYLASRNKIKLDTLDLKSKKISKDIKLLDELEWKLRNGLAYIVESEEE